MSGMNSILRARVGRFAILSAILTLSTGALAAPRMMLEGQALDARSEAEAQVRLSLNDWAQPEQARTVVEGYRQYASTQDADGFLKLLEQQTSLGYLFTSAATGYSVKYAWVEQSGGGSDERMVFLLTPGLKTRNPVLWKNPSQDTRPFTLVELQWQGEQAVAKTSLDGEIVVDDAGRLTLADFESAETFAELQDDTPYYLRDPS